MNPWFNKEKKDRSWNFERKLWISKEHDQIWRLVQDIIRSSIVASLTYRFEKGWHCLNNFNEKNHFQDIKDTYKHIYILEQQWPYYMEQPYYIEATLGMEKFDQIWMHNKQWKQSISEYIPKYQTHNPLKHKKEMVVLGIKLAIELNI